MIKWAKLSSGVSKPRFDYLVEQMKAHHIETECEHVVLDANVSNQDLEAKLTELKSQFSQIRISGPFCERVAAQLNKNTAQAILMNSCDALIKQAGGWWPRSFLEKGFSRALSKVLDSAKATNAALIVGINGQTVPVIAALMKAGYTSFNFVDEDTENGLKFIQNLKRNFFNAEFKFTPVDKLALLPGIHSMVVNTTPFVMENPVLSELNFMNFLMKEGIVVDFNYYPSETLLIKTAQGLGYQIISGTVVACMVDLEWASQCFKFQPDVKTYCEGFIAKINQEPFDMTPFLELIR